MGCNGCLGKGAGMKHIPIRLGPLAILLALIGICMTTLGVLCFTTARADLKLAEKYAETVHIRYELEAEGQAFLSEAAAAWLAGTDLRALPGTETDEGGIVRRSFEREGFTLTIGIVPGKGKGIRIVEWQQQKEWEPEESRGSLWTGN